MKTNKDYIKNLMPLEIRSKVSKGIGIDTKVNPGNIKAKNVSTMNPPINKNTYKDRNKKDVKLMPTNKVILTSEQVDQRVKKLGERSYMNVSQHELIVAGKFFEGVDFIIQKDLIKSLEVKGIIKKGAKSITTLYGITYSILNLDMYGNLNTVEKFALVKRVSNLTTKYLILLNTMSTLTRFKFNNILNAQIRLVVTSLIDKEYDVTCLLDKNYTTGLNEQQVKDKYPSKDQTLSILQYKLKNVSSNINTILRELVKEAFNSYTIIFNIVFKNLPALLRSYIYGDDLTIREKDWLDIDYILTILDIGYFNKSSGKLNALFTPTQRNQLETYIEELMFTIKIPYICSFILMQTPNLEGMFRDYGWMPKYVAKFDHFKTNHSNVISLSPSFFSESKVISNTQFANLLSALENITTNLSVLLVTEYGEEYTEINKIINYYKTNPLSLNTEELIPNVISEKVEIVKEEIPIQSTVPDKDKVEEEKSPLIEKSLDDNNIKESVPVDKDSKSTIQDISITQVIESDEVEDKDENDINIPRVIENLVIETNPVPEVIVQEKPRDKATEKSTKGSDIVINEKLTIQSEPLVQVDIARRDAWMKPIMPFVKPDKIEAELEKERKRKLHKEEVKKTKAAKKGLSKTAK